MAMRDLGNKSWIWWFCSSVTSQLPVWSNCLYVGKNVEYEYATFFCTNNWCDYIRTYPNTNLKRLIFYDRNSVQTSAR